MTKTWTPPIARVPTFTAWEGTQPGLAPHRVAYPFGLTPDQAVSRYLQDPANGLPRDLVAAAAVTRPTPTLPLVGILAPPFLNAPHLWSFQRDAGEAFLGAWQQGRDRGLIVIPTGGGKTEVFSQISREYLTSPVTWTSLPILSWLNSVRSSPSHQRPPGQILVITHTEEILHQDAERLRAVLGDPDQVGIVRRGVRQWDQTVVVASISTLIGMDPEERGPILERFGLVVLDEAHHYVHGNEWFVPLQEMGFFGPDGAITWNWPKALLGVTATPDRYTGPPLRTTFGPDGLLYAIDIEPLIEMGILRGIHLTEVRVTSEGTTDPLLALRRLNPMEKARLIEECFREILTLTAQGRYLRTRIFVQGVAEIPIIVDSLNEHGIRALGITSEEVFGAPLGVERGEALRMYREGRFDALVTRDIGLEGHNDPGTEAVVLILKSDSRARIVQRIGRSLRRDPREPELTQAIVIDLGFNLERHDIRSHVDTLYYFDPGGHLTRGGGEGTWEPGREHIGEVQITEVGDLFAVRSYPHFGQALRVLLPTPEAVERLAYQSDTNSDRLFCYWNGLELPTSLAAVEDLAQEIGDAGGTLADAWAWERVREMDKTDPLRVGQSEEEKALAQWYRFGVFRWFGGSHPASGGEGQRTLEAFWRDGTLPLHNQPRKSLKDFYDDLLETISNGREELRVMGRGLINETIKAQRGWDRPADGLSREWQVLLEAARDLAIERYRGEPLMTGPDAIPQTDPLRPFLFEAALPTGGVGLKSLTLSLRQFLSRTDPAENEAIQQKIDRALASGAEWSQPLTATGPAMTRFHDWAVRMFLRYRNGVVPRLVDDNVIQHAVALRAYTFCRRREWPELGDIGVLQSFVDLLLVLPEEATPEQRLEGRRLFLEAQKERLGWDRPSGLGPTLERVLDLFRTVALERCYGTWPTTGTYSLPSRSALRLFLFEGREVSMRDYQKELQDRIAQGNPKRTPEVASLLEAAAKEQERVETDRLLGLAPGERPAPATPPSPAEELRTWLQGRLRPQPDRLRLLQPSHLRFLRTGELPRMMYGRYSIGRYYQKMLNVAAGDDPGAREEGRGRIRKVLKEGLGWTEAYRRSLPTPVDRALDHYFNIICDKYGGTIPEICHDIPRGDSALRKILVERRWPQFRGTHADGNTHRFESRLERFFTRNGIPADEARRLVRAAADAA